MGERGRLAKLTGVISVLKFDHEVVLVPHRVADDHHFQIIARDRGVPFQDTELERHPVDDFALQRLEFNLQDDVRDVPTSVVVQFGHHEVATPLHVMRFHRDRIPREHPIPTAQRHDDEHEEHGTGHGDTGGRDLPLEGGE